MKHLYGTTGLVEYGIAGLTGEACGYSIRTLCDVSDKGRKLLSDFFGMPDISLARNWNTRVGADEATGSIMLPRAIFPDLMLYILWHVEKCDVVIRGGDGSLIGLNKGDRYYQQYVDMSRESGGAFTVLRNPVNPLASVGGRNIHSFTGRSV